MAVCIGSKKRKIVMETMAEEVFFRLVESASFILISYLRINPKPADNSNLDDYEKNSEDDEPPLFLIEKNLELPPSVDV
jgi:hypothetical protein